MTTCHAAQCTVPAVIAVRWANMIRGGRSRTEPVCEGHRLALRRLKDGFTVVSWVPLTRYEEQAATSVTIDLADLFRTVMTG